MTQLVQTQLRIPTRTIAGVALAAALAGGILGSGLQALSRGATTDGRGGGLSARDLVVLQAAQEWETRYRQMYPNSR